jgi:hypothetical protein
MGEHPHDQAGDAMVGDLFSCRIEFGVDRFYAKKDPGG